MAAPRKLGSYRALIVIRYYDATPVTKGSRTERPDIYLRLASVIWSTTTNGSGSPRTMLNMPYHSPQFTIDVSAYTKTTMAVTLPRTVDLLAP